MATCSSPSPWSSPHWPSARDLGWLRRWLLVACTATAVITVSLARLLVLTGIVTRNAVRYVMFDVLDQGGVVGQPNGFLRLAFGSGIYLLVGVALVAWEIVERPRRLWPWLVMALFVAALLRQLHPCVLARRRADRGHHCGDGDH